MLVCNWSIACVTKNVCVEPRYNLLVFCIEQQTISWIHSIIHQFHFKNKKKKTKILNFNFYSQKFITAHCNKWWHRILTRKHCQFNGKIRKNGECDGWHNIGAMPINGSNGSYFGLKWHYNVNRMRVITCMWKDWSDIGNIRYNGTKIKQKFLPIFFFFFLGDIPNAESETQTNGNCWMRGQL